MIDFSDAPVYSRKESFEMTLNLLNEKTKNPFIVEIGCIRAKDDLGAGNSSSLFSWYVTKHGGSFLSCDNNQRNLLLCQKLLSEYTIKNPNIYFKLGDGVETLKQLTLCPDLIYFDSMDCSVNDFIDSANHHIDLFRAIEPILKKDTLLLIDDIHDSVNYFGKGYLLIPLLLEKGYECLYRGYQFLFKVK